MTPCQKTSFERAIKKTLRGLLRVCLCLEEKRMPLLGSWTFFQKESTMQNMKKSKINYLPTIHLSQKSVCKTYIHFLVDIFEVLELSHIFIQADEQVYARIIYIWYGSTELFIQKRFLLWAVFIKCVFFQRVNFQILYLFSFTELVSWFRNNFDRIS